MSAQVAFSAAFDIDKAGVAAFGAEVGRDVVDRSRLAQLFQFLVFLGRFQVILF